MNIFKKQIILLLHRSKLLIICTYLLIVLSNIYGLSAGEKDSLQLTDAEKAWLEAHPVIRVAPDPALQPIEFFDEDGNYLGIGADYVKLISEKTGIKFEIVQCANWDEVIDRAQKRDVDVLNAVVKTPQREKYLIFPTPYLELPLIIVVRKDVTTELTLEMLKDSHIVMVSGYGYVDLIRNKYPDTEIELVPEIKTALHKVSFGTADAFVGDLATASFYIEQEGLTNLKLAGEAELRNVLGFAVRSDWPELSQILEKGIALLTESEKKAIHSKWINLESAPGLTTKEFQHLAIISLSVIFLMIVGFLLWNRTLKHIVRQRTQELQKEVEEKNKAELALKIAHSELEEKVAQRTQNLSEEIRNRKILEEELAKEKRFLEAVLQNIQEGIVVCDKDGVLTLFNRAAREIHGLPETQIFPDQWAEHYDLYQADGVTRMSKKEIPLFRALQGESVKTFEMTVIPKTTSPGLYISSSQPLRDENNVIIGAVATMHDITEQKKAERLQRNAHLELEKMVKERTSELQQSLKKLEEETAEREKMETALRQSHKMEAIGTLAGGIAHDFNNILAAIIGYADMASECIPDNNPAKEQIAEVLSAGNRAKELVKHILAFSRNSSQVQVPTNIYIAVKEAIQFLRASIPSTIELKANIDENSGNVLANETQINQIVVNLCTNSAHAMGENGGTIEVTLASYEQLEKEQNNKFRLPYPTDLD